MHTVEDALEAKNSWTCAASVLQLKELAIAYRRNVGKKLRCLPLGDRYDCIRCCCGEGLRQRLAAQRVFVIGCGAIGCELVKNFAMLGIAASEKGALILTDPDHIENSNLSRQFLFRERHIRRPKSAVAAGAALHMNSSLRVIARLDRVCSETQGRGIFTERWFAERVDIVANALDNVQARRFVDGCCVRTRRPLLESGTLGAKAHVQVIVPFVTENYGSQADGNNEGDDAEIPHCTLKMFPE